MALRDILLMMTLINVCNGKVPSGTNKYISMSDSENQCEAICEQCFPIEDSLKRMGCLEECVDEEVFQFTCPGKQSFLSVVSRPSPELQAEIKAFYAKRSDLLSAKDIEGVAAQFSENSVVIIDNQIPVIGRANRANKLRDLFIANPSLYRKHVDPVKFGEEYGVIWVNGMITDYDDQDKPVSSIRFMSLLEHVDDVLQETLMVLFQ